MSRREFKPWKMVESQLGGVHHIFQDGGSRDWEISVSGDVEIAELVLRAPELLNALEYAVEKYGKPGGPWNVPSDPGGWLEMAREAIRKARGE